MIYPHGSPTPLPFEGFIADILIDDDDNVTDVVCLFPNAAITVEVAIQDNFSLKRGVAYEFAFYGSLIVVNATGHTSSLLVESPRSLPMKFTVDFVVNCLFFCCFNVLDKSDSNWNGMLGQSFRSCSSSQRQYLSRAVPVYTSLARAATRNIGSTSSALWTTWFGRTNSAQTSRVRNAVSFILLFSINIQTQLLVFQ